MGNRNHYPRLIFGPLAFVAAEPVRLAVRNLTAVGIRGRRVVTQSIKQTGQSLSSTDFVCWVFALELINKRPNIPMIHSRLYP